MKELNFERRISCLGNLGEEREPGKAGSSWLVQLIEEQVPHEESVEVVIGLKDWAGCRGDGAPAGSAVIRAGRSRTACCV